MIASRSWRFQASSQDCQAAKSWAPGGPAVWVMFTASGFQVTRQVIVFQVEHSLAEQLVEKPLDQSWRIRKEPCHLLAEPRRALAPGDERTVRGPALDQDVHREEALEVRARPGFAMRAVEPQGVDRAVDPVAERGGADD